MERRGRRRKQLLDDLRKSEDTVYVLITEALDRTLENSFRKSLWTCGKRDYRMNECGVIPLCHAVR